MDIYLLAMLPMMLLITFIAFAAALSVIKLVKESPKTAIVMIALTLSALLFVWGYTNLQV